MSQASNDTERPGYSVRIEPDAWKQIMALSTQRQSRVFDAIEALEIEPRPSGVVKLQGGQGYRVRVGDYRIVYEIEDAVLVVVVVRVAKRGDVYRSRG